MLRPRPRILKAAIGALGLIAITSFSGVHSWPASTAASATVTKTTAPESPLGVSLSQVTPSVLGARGPVTVTGTITNNDKVAWLDVGIYPFVANTPLTTGAELAANLALPADAEVGGRILTEGAFQRVARIEPGQTVSYTLRITRDVLAAASTGIAAGQPGVYWFGVHALGSGPTGSDNVADGRARTFLPLIGPTASPVPMTVAVPVRAAIAYSVDGALTHLGQWEAQLGPDGRLARLASLAASPDGRDLSWLVDPAVLAAVQQLAAGNPSRRPIGHAVPSDSPSATESSATDGLAVTAAAWLTQMTTALKSADVLALPFGDLDLTGAAAHNPGVYDLARKRSAAVFADLGITTTPVNAPVDGSLDAAGTELLGAVASETPVLVNHAALSEATATPVSELGDLRLVAINAETAKGPGPDNPFAATTVRQRLLSELAIRSLAGDPTPLIVALPNKWSPSDMTQLAVGLRQGWATPTPLHTTMAISSYTPITAADLTPPAPQAALGLSSFESATALIRAGRTLQRVLTGNDTVATATLDEALASLSYERRGPTDTAREASSAINALLGRITIRAPRKVTLSGSTGHFAVTIDNPLQAPITLTLRAVTDGGLKVTRTEPVSVAAKSRATVPMSVSNAHVGVHVIELILTDDAGARFGTSVSLPVRAAQVSNVIWIFIGGGCVLLFGAIGARLWRRVRSHSDE